MRICIQIKISKKKEVSRVAYMMQIEAVLASIAGLEKFHLPTLLFVVKAPR